MAMFVLDVNDVPLLSKLPNEQAQILLATRTLDKASYKALAIQLNIPMGTVKSRINRGRKALDKIRPVKALVPELSAVG